ncbi:hypothetical protein IQ254_30535, partial [Nodosilinea sp. LEGE 07088]|uniref:hypothetical protein n=1 Tax=Nodosilinea sp. LEGE 07088 TaxID=2777968 RepID=UPI00187E4AAF
MTQQSRSAALLRVAGHLAIDSEAQQRNFELLRRSLARTVLPPEKTQLITSNFSFEQSDLFFHETIPKARRETLDQLARNQDLPDSEPVFRLFVREVPLRETLIYGSVPTWAAGAKVSHSIGPFTNQDGRQFWYDFFPIKQLIALYIQGDSEPALLFESSTLAPSLPPITRRLTTFNLAPGSLWVKARYLAANAPAGTYTGLTVQSGTIQLSNRPANANNQLTVPANTVIQVRLALQQPEVVGADTTTSWGQDARNLRLRLPSSLAFQFSSQGRQIEAVGEASWQLYGQSLDFVWNRQGQTTYDPGLQRIVIPFTASEQRLEIGPVASELNTVQNAAPISRSAWTLSVATINSNQPPEAEGIGAMLVETGAGLVDRWQGMAGGGLRLSHPAFLVSPGQIFLADLGATNPHARQSLNLWQDEINPFGTTVNLTFPTPTPLFYGANANGNELVSALTNADFQIDRPVKVNGEPPPVRSLNSVLILAASASQKLIYLFDDNLIQDSARLNNQDPIVPEQFALALTNALFKVSQVNGCLLFGTLADDYGTVASGFLFLTFGLYAYLPP